MVDPTRSPAAGDGRLRPRRRPRGSVLIATLVFLVLIATLAFAVLDLALTTYRLSMRNQLRAQARAVAESELEFIFYRFKSVAVTGTSADKAPAALTAYCDNSDTPTTEHDPFLKVHRDAGWKVLRSLERVRGPEPGIIPGTTKTGLYTYLVARVEVIPPPSHIFRNTAHVRVGRRFMNSNTSIFQYSMFFQGNLELNPGSDTVVNGDIVANGSVYLGATSGHTLTINNKIRFLTDHLFNQDTDGNTARYNPDAPSTTTTFVDPVGVDGTAIVDRTHPQVETMDEPENLLGGIDVTATATSRPDLFAAAGASLTDPSSWSAEELAIAENNVHRSLITPPPDAAASTEYPNATSSTPDDSVIAVRRAYNKAGLIVTVAADNTVSVLQVDADGTATDATAAYAGVVTDTTSVYDQREGKNVTITDIDVAALKTKLDALTTPINGLLYVNLKGSSASTPAAVRLVNGTSLPENDGAGFSVATNGGLYVQGSYNTTQITDSDGTTRHVPAMLMADAITVLSTNWDDANASAALSSRVASLSTAEGTTTEINAGLLTGNITSTTSNSSGGAQNLVRYLEDWTGKSVNFRGSLGRLFTSTQMTGPYLGTSYVYRQPNRVFDFDTSLPTHRPPGGPESTAFSRGSFFTW